MMIEELRALQVGETRLTIHTEYDTDPDVSFLGQPASWRNIKADDYVFDRNTHLFAGPETENYRRIWRDTRGRIVANEDLSDNARTYRFIVPSSDENIFKYARQNAERLDALYRERWWFIGIVAKVIHHGRVIGESSLWGIESDADNITAEARCVAKGAIAEAKEYIEKVQKPKKDDS